VESLKAGEVLTTIGQLDDHGRKRREVGTRNGHYDTKKASERP
jgi:hypothetical protein